MQFTLDALILASFITAQYSVYITKTSSRDITPTTTAAPVFATTAPKTAAAHQYGTRVAPVVPVLTTMAPLLTALYPSAVAPVLTNHVYTSSTTSCSTQPINTTAAPIAKTTYSAQPVSTPSPVVGPYATPTATGTQAAAAITNPIYSSAEGYSLAALAVVFLAL